MGRGSSMSSKSLKSFSTKVVSAKLDANSERKSANNLMKKLDAIPPKDRSKKDIARMIYQDARASMAKALERNYGKNGDLKTLKANLEYGIKSTPQRVRNWTKRGDKTYVNDIINGQVSYQKDLLKLLKKGG